MGGTRLGNWINARRRTHSALGETTQRRTPVWGLAKGAVRPVHYSQETATWGNSWGIREGNGGERSPASGYVVSHRTGETARQR